MALAWPLRIGTHEVIPVEVEAGTDKFHLLQRRPDNETFDVGRDEPDVGSAMTADRWLEDQLEPVWEVRTPVRQARRVGE